MHLPMKLLGIFLSVLLVCSFLLCGCSPTGPVASGSGTETIGVLVDDHGKGVSGASVKLFIGDTLKQSDSSIYRMTTTDVDGKYSFDSLPSGKYVILGKTPDTSKVVYKSFQRDSIKQYLNNGPDTLFSPGVISGCIDYPTIDSLDNDVLVYVLGTPYNGYSYNGYYPKGEEFSLRGIPKGTYTLKFSRDNFFVKKLTDVIVYPGKTTKIGGCTVLDVDTTNPPPPPRVDAISQNEISGSVTIKWHPVNFPTIAGYNVYDADGDISKPIGSTIDTFFDYTVFTNPLKDTVSKKVTYQIKSINRNTDESLTKSDKLSLLIFPPCFYRNKYTFTLKTSDGGDTITDSDTVKISVNFTNRKRIPEKIVWYVDSIGNVVATHTVVSTLGNDSSRTGSDTFLYNWKTPGFKVVYLKSTDNRGDSFIDSLNVNILDHRNFLPKEQWIPGLAMNENRNHACAAVLDSFIYVIGGMRYDLTISKINVSATVERYNLKTSKWSRGVNLPVSGYHAASLAYDGKIYVFGGVNNAGFCTTIYSFQPGDVSWHSCGKLPYGLCGMDACQYGDKILLIGGKYSIDENTTDFSNVILEYDPLKESIDTLCTLDMDSSARGFGQSFIINDMLYMLGGSTEEGIFGLSDCIVFNLKTKTVLKSLPMPGIRKRMYFAAWEFNNKLFIAGGCEDLKKGASYMYNDIQSMDLSAVDNGWHVLSSKLPQAVCGAVSVSADNGLYMIGGATAAIENGTEIKTVEIYYP